MFWLLSLILFTERFLSLQFLSGRWVGRRPTPCREGRQWTIGFSLASPSALPVEFVCLVDAFWTPFSCLLESFWTPSGCLLEAFGDHQVKPSKTKWNQVKPSETK